MEEKNNSLSLVSLIPTIRELVARGEEFELRPKGRSMRPTIKEGRDTVLLSRAEPPYEIGDLLFFCREGNVPVLHRLVGFTEDGKLIIRGDAQYYTETITEEQIVAAVKRYYKRGREVRTDARCTKFRTRLLLSSYPIRVRVFCLKNKIKGWFRK